MPCPVAFTGFSMSSNTSCLYTVTPQIEILVGAPMFLHCAWNCSGPSSWGYDWFFNGKGLDVNRFKVPKPSKVG